MNVIKFASITKKITLAIAALFLALFLLVHLGINLCLLRGDGGEWYRIATHFMGTNYIVKVIEIVLIAAILIHILLAIFLQIQNWKSRPVRYAVATKSKTSFMSKYMIWTGLMIVLFFCLHFYNFYSVKVGVVDGKYMIEMNDLKHAKIEECDQAKLMNMFQNKDENAAEPFHKVATNLTKPQIEEALGKNFKHYEPDFYNMCRELFKDKVYLSIYLLCFLLVAFHLSHGIKAAFQTLGLNHSKYNCAISITSYLYAALMFAGFAAIALYLYFLK